MARLLLLLLAACAARAAAAANASAPLWLPLTLVEGHRAGLRGAAAPAAPFARARARMLRENAYVLEGSTKVGYYTAPIQLGTPPRRFNLILDTGSSVTVVPCAGCQCGYAQSAPYDASASSTADTVSCADDWCPRDKSRCSKKQPDDTCDFANRYADGTQVGGDMRRDLLLIPRGGGQAPEVLPRFSFGCSKYSSGNMASQYADGIAGLSFGPVSLPNQLRAAHAKAAGAPPNSALGAGGAITLCLGRKGGAMSLGRAGKLPGVGALSYTGLLPSAMGFYVLQVVGFKVAGVPLTLSQTAWSPDSPEIARGSPANANGIILDSGATFSYFGTEAYNAVAAALDAALAPLAAPAGARNAANARGLYNSYNAGGRRRLAGAAPSSTSSVAAAVSGALRRLRQVSARTAELVMDYGGVIDDDYSSVAPAAGRPGASSRIALNAGRGGGSGVQLTNTRASAAAAVVVTPTEDSLRGGDKCWTLTGPGVEGITNAYDLIGIFPDLEITFGGGAVLPMPASRYMHVSLRTKGTPTHPAMATACLGIFDGGGESILGAVALRDAIFEFDYPSKRVGFADADCAVMEGALGN